MKLGRNAVVNKTILTACAMLLSKVLGLVRDIFRIRYLGVGAVADAFQTAWRLPNSLRKIFAEGALSAALVPSVVTSLKHGGKKSASGLVTLFLMIVQVLVTLVCVPIALNTTTVLSYIVPGWGPERIAMASPLLAILIFFIAFISATSIFAGALQAAHAFTLPMLSQSIMNVCLTVQLALCLYFNLPVSYLAWGIIGNGILLVALHAWEYKRQGFTFTIRTDDHAWTEFKRAMGKFLPCIPGVGAMEISLFVDGVVASYLAVGSVALLDYISGFVRIPIQVFGSAFSSILLPHLSRIGAYAPRRLSYYVYESIKLIFWIAVPSALLLAIFSHKMLFTLLLSEKFTLDHVNRGAVLLTLFSGGVFFFCLNRTLLNVYYALHNTVAPTVLTLLCVGLNAVLDITLAPLFGLQGIVLATVAAEIVRTFLLLMVLHTRMKLAFYGKRLANFMIRSLLQAAVAGCVLYALYRLVLAGVMQLPTPLMLWCTQSVGYWLWVSPLVGLVALGMYMTRQLAGIRLHFLV